MANFSTHINTAALTSAIGVGVLANSGIIDIKTSLYCFLAGIIGGILPDIDHDNSTPLKIMHFVFANLAAFFVIYNNIARLKLLEMFIIWGGIYLLFAFIFYIFKKTTKHRGMIHSIPAGILFGVLASFLFYKLGFSLKQSYIIGIFLFSGYIVHLILDEIFSVDLAGRKIKKSFGSALKICSKDKKINFFVYFLLFLSVLSLPQKEILLKIFKGIFNV